MKYLKYLLSIVVLFLFYSCNERISDSNPSEQNYEIVFTSNRDGNDEIYVMNKDGSNQTRLTNDPAEDWFPKWSPNGEKIAFLSARNESTQLFVMNKDGSEQKQITTNLNIYSGYEWIEWSSDNSSIVISVFSNLNIQQIYIVNSDGSNQRFLIEGNYPNWTKQNKIIFGGDGICSINPDGSELIQITDGTQFDFRPVVSPKTNKILFRSFRDNDSGMASLHVMNLDGSDIKELTKKNPIIKPTWSPNNFEALIVAPVVMYGEEKIFRININSNNEELIVDLGNIESSPVYSSSGNYVIFSALSETASRVDIYIKNLQNGIISNLTLNTGIFPFRFNDYPDWNPTK